MSSWPLTSDFARMIKTPQAAFRDPVLRECAIEMNHLGQPKPRSGNFATVYKAIRPDGRELAVRTFNRRADLRRERYRLVSDYLEGRPINSVVHFEYDEKGVRSSDGKFYPMITMEWVPGVSLFEWTRDRSREGYREALNIAADVWLQVVRELAAHGIVHGDLQHGNVLVSSEGYFKLVDYDCMAVPGLMGQQNTEIGMVPYQHPMRNADTLLFPGLDNFSALVIYVALRGLAAAPHLWITHVDQVGYDKLLFRKEDFENPNASRLYHDLMNSPDEQVRDLTHYLMQLARYNLQDVPPVDEVLLWCNSLDSLIAARDWDMAVQLVRRMGPHEQIPAHLAQVVQEAQRRVACRQALEQALASGDEGEIGRAYIPQLLDNYPAAAQLVEQARMTTRVTQALEVLKAAMQYQNWEVFKNTWMAHQPLLAGRKSAEPYRKEMQKIIAVDTLRKLMKDQAADDRAITEAWKYLQSLGGHATAEPLLPHLQWRTQRQQLFEQLSKLVANKPAAPTLDYDRQLAEMFKPNVFDGQPRYQEILTQHKAALLRLKKLRAYLELGEQPCTLENERKLAGALTELPEAYHPKLRQRSRLAMRRVKAMHKLQQSIADGSDLGIIAARDALVEAESESLLTDEHKQRVEAARKRQPLLEKLSGLSHNWPPSELDRKILEIWDETALAGCRDAEQWLPTYQRARQRKVVLAGLEKAIDEIDLPSIDRLLADPSLRGYPMPNHITQGVDDARVRHQQQLVHRKQALLASLMEGDRGVFYELFDARVLMETCRQYQHHQAVVARMIESEVLPLGKSGLAAPEGASALERNPENENEFIARWQWPPARFANECRLIVCAKMPPPHANPAEVPAVYSVSITRAQWEAEGQCHRIAIVPEWLNHHVVVWFQFEMEFQSFHSHPLELGVLAPPKKKKGWSLFG